MLNTNRSVVVLLAVVAALLVLNLTKGGVGQTAAAEQTAATEGEPYVVEWLGASNTFYWRVWSDGQVDQWIRPTETCDFSFQLVLMAGVDHPFPVVESNLMLNGQYALTMEFADGRVDYAASPDFTRCTIAGPGSDPFCLGDVDRDGFTDTTDLLTLLADWGECVDN